MALELTGNATDRPTNKQTFLEFLFDRHARELHGYLRVTLPNTHMAEDALQETFIRAAQHWKKIQRAENVRAYLFRMARNEAFRLVGREKRHVEGQETLASSPLLVPKPDMEDRTAEIERLEQALHRIPRDQREIVVLKCIQGFTFSEIAETLEISENTASSRYRYGLEKLRKVMET